MYQLRKKTINTLHNDTLERVKQEYTQSDKDWIVAYSGGKDSSVLLMLVLHAVEKIKKRQITIAYCNSGVEIPLVKNFAYKVLRKIIKKAQLLNLPIKTKIVYPKYKERFFVKIIGRGYPPPTNKFRWCTDRLRVNPLRSIYSNNTQTSWTVLLGIRKNESQQRDRGLAKYTSQIKYHFEQSKNNNIDIYCPLIDYDTNDIWDLLLNNSYNHGIDFVELARLYNVIGDRKKRAKQDNPSTEDIRFGCWICTVVRKDKAMHSLIQHGHVSLKPLLSFRNWLADIRDNVSYRCSRRRNGQIGPGPFTMRTRKRILEQLLEVQKIVPWQLITKEEIRLIKLLWANDRI